MMRRRADIAVEIDRLAYGGDGVGRDASGRVVFVPRTAPGDKIRAIVHQESARFARAKLAAIVEPGAARVEPACPVFERCGGCAWQHIDYAAQAEAKRAAATFALRRLLTTDTAVAWEGMAQTAHWRRRARLHFRRVEEALYFGFFAPQSHRIVDTDACLQLTPALQGLLPALRSALLKAKPGEGGEVHVLEGANGALHVAVVGADDAEMLALIAAHPNVVGASCEPHGRNTDAREGASARRSHGAPHVEIDPGVHACARDFVQAGREANEAMRRHVLHAAGDGNGRALLELYAGGGNFSAVLHAAGWRVLANDLYAPPAPVPWRFVAQDVGEFLMSPEVAAGAPYDVVLLDPPRAGALDVAGALPRLGAKTVVYVSCDVMTLARDAAAFVGAGYALRSLAVIDAMPQTSHFEVIATFARAEPA